MKEARLAEPRLHSLPPHPPGDALKMADTADGGTNTAAQLAHS